MSEIVGRPSARRMVVQTLASLVGLIATTSHLTAQITYTIASRSVSAFASGSGSDTDPDRSASYSSDAFGTFDHGVSVSTVVAGAGAYQLSTLAHDQIFFHGYASGGGLNRYDANAQTTFFIGFSLAEASPFGLRARAFYGEVVLYGSAFGEIRTAMSAPNIEYYGQLPAGDYTLRANCSGYNTSGRDDVTGIADLVLTVPTPCTLGIAAVVPFVIQRKRRR